MGVFRVFGACGKGGARAQRRPEPSGIGHGMAGADGGAQARAAGGWRGLHVARAVWGAQWRAVAMNVAGMHARLVAVNGIERQWKCWA